MENNSKEQTDSQQINTQIQTSITSKGKETDGTPEEIAIQNKSQIENRLKSDSESNSLFDKLNSDRRNYNIEINGKKNEDFAFQNEESKIIDNSSEDDEHDIVISSDPNLNLNSYQKWLMQQKQVFKENIKLKSPGRGFHNGIDQDIIIEENILENSEDYKVINEIFKQMHTSTEDKPKDNDTLIFQNQKNIKKQFLSFDEKIAGISQKKIIKKKLSNIENQNNSKIDYEQELKNLRHENNQLKLKIQGKDCFIEMLQKEISSKDSLLNEISGSISSNQKKLEDYRNNLKDMQEKINQLVKKVTDFVLDEQQPRIKKILLSEKEDNSTSSVLYLHYEDKMHELSHLIKLGSQYLTDSKRDIIYTEECIICCESLHENVALSYSKQQNKGEECKKDEKERKLGGKFKIECGHDCFHEQCIIKWLQEKSVCPLCKAHIGNVGQNSLIQGNEWSIHMREQIQQQSFFEDPEYRESLREMLQQMSLGLPQQRQMRSIGSHFQRYLQRQRQNQRSDHRQLLFDENMSDNEREENFDGLYNEEQI